MALLTTLAFMAAALLVFGSIWFLIGGSAKVTAQNKLYNISRAAAEGATEMVVTKRDYIFSIQPRKPPVSTRR